MSNLPQLFRKNETALLKTASYYVIHIVVAAAVAFAVTGDVVAAMTLSLLEPTIQAGAYFVHEKIWGMAPRTRYRTLVKTLTYYVMHLSVAACVAYSVTGDLLASLTLSLLEPTVQMAFFFLHEKLWEQQQNKRLQEAQQKKVQRTIMLVCASAAGCTRAQACTHECALQQA